MKKISSKEKDKDPDRESGDKKRRKNSSTEPSGGSSSRSAKEDIYASVVKMEEQEAQSRPAEKDSEVFRNTCIDLKKIFTDILLLKIAKTEKTASEVTEKRIEGGFQFVLAKKLNRLDKIRLRAGRDALHKEKLRVDSNRLQLQNLLYEAEHLRKEVRRCYQFKSQDEEIELVPENEFYASAPETVSRPDKTKVDEHARRLARLEWELQQRKELASNCKELQASKEKVALDISSKTERLESLAPRLDSLLKSTKPLQEALEMPIEKEWETQKIARLLPRPLYLLFANMLAYSEACDKNITVSIQGDEEEAKQLADNIKDIEDEVDDGADVNNQDSDNDDLENEKKKSHHRRGRRSKEVVVENKQNKIFKAHPLNIVLKVKNKDAPQSLSITVYYLTHLNFVTVVCKLLNFENIGVAASDVVAQHTILDCLFPNDYGVDSPSPKTNYQLSDASLNPKQLITYLDEKKLGKPYKWAQYLCGYEFFDSDGSNASGINVELAQNTVPDVVKKIRQRWNARVSLHKQIYALEHKQVDLFNSSNVGVRVASSLVQWSAITWEDYAASPVTQHNIEEGYSTQHDLFYRAIVTRGSAKLECLICVFANFPTDHPLWSLSLSWNGMRTSLKNASIREMEYWVNSLAEPSRSFTILSAQLHRAMTSLDIYLETEGPLFSPAEFTADKTFLKPFRGRTRSRPYRAVQNGGSVVFTQI